MLRVFLIEDNPDHMRWLLDLMKRQGPALGYRVVRHTTDWSRARRVLREASQEFDVVVSDLQDFRTMRFTGFEVLRAARKMGKGVIAVSSFLDDAQNMRDIISSGADFYVKKPFRPDWRNRHEFEEELHRSAELQLYFALRRLREDLTLRPPTGYDVFLSYSSSDRALAQELAERLQVADLQCFLAEKSIGAGEYWVEEVRRGLVGARAVLLLLTEASIRSPWVLCEAGAAWVLGKPLFPAVASGSLSDLPEAVRGRQAREILTVSGREGLIDEIRASLATV